MKAQKFILYAEQMMLQDKMAPDLYVDAQGLRKLRRNSQCENFV